MKRSIGVVMVFLSFGLVATGCGGKEEQMPGAAGSPTATPGAPPQQPGKFEGGQLVIEIKDNQFNPENATLPAGGTVIFVNNDRVAHTITKRRGPGPDFDSGPLDPGRTFSQVFNRKGTVEVFDKSRPNLELTITVEEEE
jgi:plastocyanin